MTGVVLFITRKPIKRLRILDGKIDGWNVHKMTHQVCGPFDGHFCPIQKPYVYTSTTTLQPLGPLLKVKLLVGYMQNPTKLKGAKGIRLT